MVWLPRLKMFAVARFHDVQAGLRAADALISGKGVSVNELMNAADAPDPVSTLTSDGEVHHQLKRTLMKPLMPTTLQPLA